MPTLRGHQELIGEMLAIYYRSGRSLMGEPHP
jgi:hypothetical protein